MGRYAPGEVVTIELERDGNSQSITVTLGEHPDQSDKAFLGIAYGVEIEIDQQLDLEQNGDTESFHFFHHLPGQAIPLLDLSTGAEAQEGVIVHQVADDSPAIGSGLEVGQIITAVDGEAVSEPGALAEIIANHAPGETLTLTVTAKDDDASQEVTVTLGEDSVQAGQAYLGVQLGHFFRIKQTGSGLDEEAMVLEWTGQISRVVESHFGDSDKIELMFDGSPLNLLPDMDFLLEHDLPALWFTDGSL
jgi:membrane-associated protease RseP (regulator of RpoE activity)